MSRSILKRYDSILRAVSGAPGALTARDIHDLLGLPRSSTYRILATLTKLGHLSVQQDGTYCVGPRLESTTKTMPVPVESTQLGQVLRAVADLNAATAFYAHFDGKQVQILDAVLPTLRNRLYVYPEFGVRPLSVCSSALAILAYQPPKILNQCRDLPLHDLNASGQGLQRIQDRLVHIREQGYAICDGEIIPEIMSIAFPVNYTGKINYSIGLIDLSSRLRLMNTRKCAMVIKDALKTINPSYFELAGNSLMC